MTDLTATGRKKLPDKDFALPEKRKYPIPDASHARNALARVDAFGTSEEKTRVRAAVKRRYPGIEQEKPTGKVRIRQFTDPEGVEYRRAVVHRGRVTTKAIERKT